MSDLYLLVDGGLNADRFQEVPDFCVHESTFLR